MKTCEVSNFIEEYNVDQQSPLIQKREWAQLGRVLSAAVKDEPSVPLSVLGKNRFLGEVKQETKNGNVTVNKTLELTSNKPHRAEAEAIADLIIFGLKYYGEPVFDYHQVAEERWEDVDFWRNILKSGRVTGVGAGSKRVQTLRDISETTLGTWNPTVEHVDAAAKRLHAIYNRSVVNNGHVKDIKLSSDTTTTNSGEPYYTRKSKSLNGQPVRKLIAEDAKSLTFSEVAHLPAFLGARNQAAKWVIESGKNAEDYLIELTKMERSAMVESILNDIEFSFKARVINAAPSIAAYQAAPLIYSFNECLKEDKSPMMFLNGPRAIKDTLMRIKQMRLQYLETEGIKLLSYNADAKSYDATLRRYHGDLVYNAVVDSLPRYKDKEQLKIIIGTSLIRPLLYLNEPVDKFTKYVIANNINRDVSEYLKSGEPDTNWFGSMNMFMTTYSSRREANDHWEHIVDYALAKFKVMPLQVIGDDNLTLYEVGKDGTIIEDLMATVTNQNDKYGLVYHDAAVKGELGEYLAQYRLTYDDRFITPLSRLKLYWSETTKKALPAYLEALKWMQLLEFRWECKGINEYLNEFVFPYDKTKLGMIDKESGVRLTVHEFSAKLKEAEEQEGLTISQMMYTGNPTDEDKYKEGTIDSDWLSEQFNKISIAYDHYLKHKR